MKKIFLLLTILSFSIIPVCSEEVNLNNTQVDLPQIGRAHV